MDNRCIRENVCAILPKDYVNYTVRIFRFNHVDLRPLFLVGSNQCLWLYSVIVMNVLSASAFPAVSLSSHFLHRRKRNWSCTFAVLQQNIMFNIDQLFCGHITPLKNRCLHVYFLCDSDSQTVNMQASISKFIY